MKWFDQLSSQEKKLIKIGLLIVVPVVFWKLIVLPIGDSYQSKLKYRELLSSQVQLMQASHEQFKSQLLTKKNYQRANNKPFIAWIDEQLTKNGLAQFVVRSEPKDSKTLILTFENVIFDEMIQWLEPLEKNYSITISEVDVNLTDRSSGMCSARITLVDN